MLSKIGKILSSVSEITKKAAEGEKESASEDLYVGPEIAEGGVAAETDISNTLEDTNSLEKMTDVLHQVSTAIHSQAEAALHQIGANASTDGSSIGKTTEPELVPHEMLHMAQHSTEADETHTLSLADAVAVLEQARTALNESGIDSDLRDLINHPDADVMIENLQAAGIDPLTVSGPEIDGQSPEEQIMSVLEAAQDATYEAGLDMPQAEQDMPEAMQSTSFDYEYTNASDDYGIV